MTKSSELTEVEKDVLINMMEEAAEVIQACSKILRFGNNSEPHKLGFLTNKQYLNREIGNFNMTRYALHIVGLGDADEAAKGKNEKHEKWGYKYVQGS